MGGEYCEGSGTIVEAFDDINTQLGEACFLLKNDEKKAQEKAAAEALAGPKMVTRNVILSNGTYATQTVYSEPKKIEDNTPNLRKLLISGDVFLGSVVSSTLTKLCLRAADFEDISPVKAKEMTMQALLVMCAVVKMATITVTAQRSSVADCSERVTLCCRALLDPKVCAMVKPIILGKGKAAFGTFLKNLKDKESA